MAFLFLIFSRRTVYFQATHSVVESLAAKLLRHSNGGRLHVNALDRQRNLHIAPSVVCTFMTGPDLRDAGLALAASGRCRSARFVEINPQCDAPFRAAAAQLTTDAQLTFHVAAAGSAPHDFIADTDVVIVDPPRKGLEPGLMGALTALPAPGLSPRTAPATHHAGAPAPLQDAPDGRGLGNAIGPDPERTSRPHTLIYLSCGFPALERDCAALLASGRWRLQHCEAFLFFPGTDSIETLAVFRRQS